MIKCRGFYIIYLICANAKIMNWATLGTWIDMFGDYTIDIKGSKTVSMGSTGHEKTRLTVCLVAMADRTISFHLSF